MATVNLSSEALGLLNGLFTSPDPLQDVLGISFDNFETLEEILSADLGDPTVTSLTGSLIELSVPTVGGPTYDVSISGQGMGPVTSLDSLVAAIATGTATGTFGGLVLGQDGTELLSLAASATTITIDSGAQSLALEGTFPTELASLSGLLAIPDLLDLETLDQLTPEARAALIASLSNVSLTSMTLTDGATTLVDFTVAPDGVTLTLPSYSITIGGDMPSNLGALATAIFAEIDDGADPLFALIGAVDINGLQFLDADGGVIASIDGLLTDPTSLTITIDGVAIPDGLPVLFDPTGNGVAFTATDESTVLIGTIGDDTLTGGAEGDTIFAMAGNDIADGGGGNDVIFGDDGTDRLLGGDGNDTISGGDGTDTLNGGDGDDFIFGGATEADLRDVVYAGAGNDSVDGGHGNDELWGGVGNDTMEGGFGTDTIRGQDGNDVLTGSAWSDLIFGGGGDDFINGGFGSDRVNGGDGADRFFHVGVAGHGSDWIQDFSHAEGDRLVWGGGAAGPANFQVNIATTPGAGDAGVDEAFVIYRPTGQILWALVDGAGEDSIDLQIGGAVYDLLV